MLISGDNGAVESPVDARARELARIIWDHLVLSCPLSKADVILALGSHDTRVAVHAARLWHEGWAPLVVVSGGRGNSGSGLRCVRERASRST